MPNSPPDGFLTRPEAAKAFNRSQRALERDITKALAMKDEKGLVSWKLVTKDGEVRAASDVTSEQVERLVNEGMVPTWCVAITWLEETYGRKGSPKPTARPTPSDPQSPLGSQPSSLDSTQNVSGKREESSSAGSWSHTEFLQERIRTLEREKKEETQRSENREAKLFEQLAVKDKQISAWDELTQGLTRGLATGQLVPSLLAGQPKVAPNQPVANTAKSESQPVQVATVVKKSSPATRKKSPSKQRSKSMPKPKRSKTLFEKHTPTFHKLASGLIRRS